MYKLKTKMNTNRENIGDLIMTSSQTKYLLE